MTYKSWTKITLGVLILPFLCLAIINLIVDPYEIFRLGFLKKPFQINERYIKITHLEDHQERYNSYMFGSSRIGNTDPFFIQQCLPGARFYNFTVAGATLYDHLAHLRYFVRRKYAVKNLYLQLDAENMAFYESQTDYLRKLHPAVLNSSRLKFYCEHLFRPFPENIRAKIETNLHPGQPTIFDFEKTGMWLKPEREKQLKENCREYEVKEISFHQNVKQGIKYIERENDMNALREIRRICDSNRINLIVFTAPLHHRMMDNLLYEDYLRFLMDIASVTDFWDFSGYNSVTTDNCNYIERVHYSGQVGKIIAARIFDNKKVSVPTDFGVLVTKKNIYNRLETLRQEKKKWQAAHPENYIL